MLDKDLIKESLTIEEVTKILTSFGSSEPLKERTKKDTLIFQTICHNMPSAGNSYKLYYYHNNKIFKCYSDSCGTFDIFELIQRIYRIQKELIITFTQSISIVADILNLDKKDYSKRKDFTIDTGFNIDKYILKDEEDVKLPTRECVEFNNLPTFRILNWEKEHISFDTIKKFNIRYSPLITSIIIPHCDENNCIVGIRGRTLIEENENNKRIGKYMPTIFSNVMYNHPLGYNLYGLNINKENIKKYRTAIIFEGEKSVLQLDSYMDNIGVAVCGSTISNWQIKKLLDYGVEEIIIAFDKEYKVEDDVEYIEYHEKINKMVNNIKNYTKVSVILDRWGLLDYKDSPTDKGKDIFDRLFERRFFVTNDI